MKKVLTIVGIVLVVVGIAFGVYMIKQGPSTVAPGVSSAPAGIPKGKPVETLASIIPADAELYLGVYNIGDGWDSLMKSAFWKELSSLQIWDQIAFKQTIETFQQEMQAQTSIEFNQDNIMELIGKQVAFALFMNNERQDTPSGLIVTKVGTKTRLLATLIELTEQGEAPYEKTDYKGVTVYLLKATEESPMDVAFAITKGNMAIEFGTKTENIKAVIDLILDKNAHKTLADNTDFRSVTDSDNGPHANQFYLNAKSILAALDAGKLPEALQDETIRTGIRATLGTVSLVGGSSKFFNGL
ncbi:DUF3352 domain-containing protein, partial [bacterium]|nr:DUF3352 domain-containing protein [bacterium]